MRAPPPSSTPPTPVPARGSGDADEHAGGRSFAPLVALLAAVLVVAATIVMAR